MDKRMTGIAGERLTCRWYTDLGYRLLSVNYHSRYGEIDIIAKQGNTLVFCEVKTRNDRAMYSAKEAVTASKQSKIKMTAMMYIDENSIGDMNVRFDVSEVYTDGESFRINVIENAFE